MIIKEMYLTNFGKFHNKKVELKPGLNIIYGENEAGKTTLHTFIRGMFFGIEKQRGKSNGKDLYSKYQPWDNPANYQGVMRVESAGVTYRIERNFDKEHKNFQVINEEEGRVLSEQEIEVLFAGLDEGCYYNTISISQLGSVTDRELEVILKNYAANLGSTKSMEINIKEAMADLESQRKRIMSEYKIGEEEMIVKALKDAADQKEISEGEQHTIIASIEQKKASIESVLEKKKELSVLDARRLEELAKQNERKDNLYKEMIEFSEEVSKYEKDLEEIAVQKQELKQQLTDNGIDGWDTMDWLTDKIMNRSNMPVAFIICSMACVGLTVGYILGNNANFDIENCWKELAIGGGATLFFVILSVIKYFYNKKKRQQKLDALKTMKLLLDKMDATKHEETYMQRQLEKRKELLVNAQNLMQIEEEKSLDAKDYSEDLQMLESEERSIQEAVSKAQWMLEQKQEKDIEIDNTISELTERYEQIQKAKEEISAIEDAKRNIEEIAMEVRSSFGKRLNERASYYMSKITDGKYDNITIDEQLNISINGKHSLLATSKLSKGTMEQIYMALRLAATDIIFEDEKMPILLDDAFVMYDNKRMGNTMKFLSRGMEQVVVFSCHTREKVMADKLGLKYNFIRMADE